MIIATSAMGAMETERRRLRLPMTCDRKIVSLTKDECDKLKITNPTGDVCRWTISDEAGRILATGVAKHWY